VLFKKKGGILAAKYPESTAYGGAAAQNILNKSFTARIF